MKGRYGDFPSARIKQIRGSPQRVLAVQIRVKPEGACHEGMVGCRVDQERRGGETVRIIRMEGGGKSTQVKGESDFT